MYDLVHMQVYRVDETVAHALSDRDVDILIHERLFVRCASGVVLVLSSPGPVTRTGSKSRSHVFGLRCTASPMCNESHVACVKTEMENAIIGHVIGVLGLHLVLEYDFLQHKT